MYKYEEKEVKIDGSKYKAIYPETHSAVEAIIWDSHDANYMDHRPGVHRSWQRVFYIRWKGEGQWELIPNDGSKGYEDLKYNHGIFAALRECETDEWKAARWAEERVRDLKTDIPQTRKDLKSMEREYSILTGRSI